MLAVRRRANQRSRIRPARQRPSAVRFGLVALGGLCGLGLAVTTLGQSTTVASVDIDPTGPYRLRSTAGPVEVASGPAGLDYRASWLLHRPEVTAGRAPDEVTRFPPGAPTSAGTAVDVSCDTRLPCRASTRIQLPPQSTIDVVASHGPILVERFDGIATVATTGSNEVVLGPVGGSILVTTEEGDVTGHGLAAQQVEVATGGGAVSLHFRDRPRSVRVVGGDRPITIELPPGNYAVTVVGNPSAIIEVARDESADSRIAVDGRGSIRIATAPPTGWP